MKHGHENVLDDENEDRKSYTLTRDNILKFGKDALKYFKIPPKPTFL